MSITEESDSLINKSEDELNLSKNLEEIKNTLIENNDDKNESIVSSIMDILDKNNYNQDKKDETLKSEEYSDKKDKNSSNSGSIKFDEDNIISNKKIYNSHNKDNILKYTENDLNKYKLEYEKISNQKMEDYYNKCKEEMEDIFLRKGLNINRMKELENEYKEEYANKYLMDNKDLKPLFVLEEELKSKYFKKEKLLSINSKKLELMKSKIEENIQILYDNKLKQEKDKLDQYKGKIGQEKSKLYIKFKNLKQIKDKLEDDRKNQYDLFHKKLKENNIILEDLKFENNQLKGENKTLIFENKKLKERNEKLENLHKNNYNEENNFFEKRVPNIIVNNKNSNENIENKNLVPNIFNKIFNKRNIENENSEDLNKNENFEELNNNENQGYSEKNIKSDKKIFSKFDTMNSNNKSNFIFNPINKMETITSKITNENKTNININQNINNRVNRLLPPKPNEINLNLNIDNNMRVNNILKQNNKEILTNFKNQISSSVMNKLESNYYNNDDDKNINNSKNNIYIETNEVENSIKTKKDSQEIQIKSDFDKNLHFSKILWNLNKNIKFNNFENEEPLVNNNKIFIEIFNKNLLSDVYDNSLFNLRKNILNKIDLDDKCLNKYMNIIRKIEENDFWKSLDNILDIEKKNIKFEFLKNLFNELIELFKDLNLSYEERYTILLKLDGIYNFDEINNFIKNNIFFLQNLFNKNKELIIMLKRKESLRSNLLRIANNLKSQDILELYNSTLNHYKKLINTCKGISSLLKLNTRSIKDPKFRLLTWRNIHITQYINIYMFEEQYILKLKLKNEILKKLKK